MSEPKSEGPAEVPATSAPAGKAPASGADVAGGGQVPEVPWFDGTVSLLVTTQEVPVPLAPSSAAAHAAAPPPVPGAGGASSASVTPPNRRPWLAPGDEIARGGMSRIQRIVDQNLFRTAAMKVLNADLSGEPVARQRFVEEAQITAQLDHPNIPPVHDLWLDAEGRFCFTMKLVRGRTLNEILIQQTPKRRTEQQLERLLQVFSKVCDAVSFAHSRGVIHRDLKPENVMVGTHGQVYVMDWGCALLRPPAPGADAVKVARDQTQSLDPPGCAIGTCSYMAPEQARATPEEIDERTDVYLLGGILYEILTGEPPHRGKSQVHSVLLAQTGEVPDPQAVAGDTKLPPGLCQIAMRALAADPTARYQTVEALKEDVERSLRHGWWFATVTFPAGSVIVHEGEEAHAAYIITRGTCEAFRQQGAERVVLRRMGAGEAFGETGIFTAKARTASVAAVDEVVALVVTRDALERAVGTDSWVGAFVRALAERFREADARLAELRRSAGESPGGG
jgi:eukaryotic-like serine/threonine-protein kinase